MAPVSPPEGRGAAGGDWDEAAGGDGQRGSVGDNSGRGELDEWSTALDPKTFPFVTRIAADLGHHEDRDQFLTGLDLLLDGLRTQVATGS
ncbi:hypothetical protein ACFWVP_30540 [Streptomyces sp. NPDC058637]|uniref:hypothetical protein n=1 Tax=Streptomyces sp. NPDC058637 TaxID=3346569 RepID=UPI003669B239